MNPADWEREKLANLWHLGDGREWRETHFDGCKKRRGSDILYRRERRKEGEASCTNDATR